MNSAFSTFFAVQLHPAETEHAVAALVIQTANEAKIRFKGIATFDLIEVGAAQFVRFRSDVINPFPVLDRLLKQGRMTIGASPGGYLLRAPSGKFGKVSLTQMHTAARPGRSWEYRGTGGWAVQF